MDIRTLLLGLGTGMLAATITFGVGDMLTQEAQPVPAPTEQKNASPAAPATDWKKEAEAAGMVVFSKDEYTQNLAKAKAEGASAKEAELANKPPTSVQVYIQSGMSTTDVADLLHAAGVLADAVAFVDKREGYPYPIRAGIYKLPLNADPLEVLKTVAKPSK